MKKKSLGAKLLRSLDEARQGRYQEAVDAAGGKGPLANLDSNSQALVAKMFESARRRIAEIINMGTGTADCYVVLGMVGPRTGMPLDSEAIRILSDACWPMTIPEGIQLSANPFHYEWEALTNWAAKDELTVQIRAELDKYLDKTVFHVVVMAR